MLTRIKVENLGKMYRLGEVGTGTISHDLNRWWAKIRGKEDPFSKVGVINDRTVKGSKDYVWALNDINFEVKEGEILGIIGRNGAGKSTLLKILSKITGPTVGLIKTNGRIGSLLEVGTGMHPELTGRENIFLNGTILGMKRYEIKAKFDEIVEFAGITKYVDTPLKRYSSGMQVRLGFAVAAFLEPEILIVDEVLAVGDAEFQKRAIGKMKEVSEGEGRTVLFVSHNMASVKRLCNKSMLLKNGTVDSLGDTEDIIKKYLNSDIISGKFINLDNIDRKKNKEFHFSSLSFDKLKYEPGDDIEFTLLLNCKDQLKYRDSKLSLNIHINDMYDNEIIHLNSNFVVNQSVYFNKESKYIFTLKNCLLKPDRYRLWLYLSSDKNGELDAIRDGLSFTIEGVNIYNYHNERQIGGKYTPFFDFETKRNDK